VHPGWKSRPIATTTVLPAARISLTLDDFDLLAKGKIAARRFAASGVLRKASAAKRSPPTCLCPGIA
jgi:hypothetical protein